MTGNSAGLSSCLAFAETLHSSKSLQQLVLADNMLTQQGVRVLLHAVLRQSERALTIDLHGASFAKCADNAPRFDEHEPDGRYCLNLGDPGERAMALEIFRWGFGVRGWASECSS